MSNARFTRFGDLGTGRREGNADKRRIDTGKTDTLKFKFKNDAAADGADSSSGDWIENDTEFGGAGPSSGQVRVSGGALQLDDQPDTGGLPSARRKVDLSGASAATLSFAFLTSSGVDSDDAVDVEVSTGAGWTLFETITGISGSSSDSRSYDITPHISSETQVRFTVSNKYGGSNEFFLVDWVEISTQ